MSSISTRAAKTSFAAGEVSTELLGRGDLRAYQNGARRLRNVFIMPTGGVTRRSGLRHLAVLAGAGRLVGFEFNTEQVYVLVFTNQLMTVFMNDAPVASIVTPWTAAQLPQLAYTQSADTLLVVHPDVAPQKITRSSHTSWQIGPWTFDAGSSGATAEPFHRFAPAAITLAPSNVTGAITLTASAPMFVAGHASARVRIGGKQVLVNNVLSPTQASATVIETLASTAATADWDEAAFSNAHGWPVTVGFHQDRLVIGGTRELPNRLWLSRSGDLFNLALGTGLDDEAIEFALMSDQVNAIRAVFSGRHLQVFTSGAEWMVTGDPLTPGNIQIVRQTRIGSRIDRIVPPIDIDGATIFVGRSGRTVHEFAYADVEAAYQANDLGILARHLVSDPVDLDYDLGKRLLHVVMANGSVGTLTIYRAEQVTAWTRLETDGAFRAVVVVGDGVYFITERAGTFALERFDESLGLDAAITGESVLPVDVWSGLGHLEGRGVRVMADGTPQGEATVTAGSITVDPPAMSVQAGLGFAHEIEPLPPDLLESFGARAAPLRLVSVTLRVQDTASLAVDTGRGARPVPFRRFGAIDLDTPPAPFTGDITVRALGWRRDAARSLWRITGDTPMPLTILAVTTEMRVNS
ncbi:MAG: hypothetical protein IT557_09935 [Alphaproteobacteria bacterium]|nr:hypothetical protein [Alphaproteobacteria bacterium]